jgi:hypothetical protein
MKLALIVTGPKDGNLIAHNSNTLDIAAWNWEEPLPFEIFACVLPSIEKLTFCRTTVGFPGGKLFDVFVPYDWPVAKVRDLLLEHLLTKAFK